MIGRRARLLPPERERTGYEHRCQFCRQRTASGVLCGGRLTFHAHAERGEGVREVRCEKCGKVEPDGR